MILYIKRTNIFVNGSMQKVRTKYLLTYLRKNKLIKNNSADSKPIWVKF